MTLVANGDLLTRVYLYGEGGKNETPEYLTDRLRDLDPSPDTVGAVVEISAIDYMATYGIYAVPARAEIVKKFFKNEIILPPGSYSLQQMISMHNGGSEDWYSFTFQHAQVDPGKNNYLDRAYVFGHAKFSLGEGTTFFVGQNGELSMSNVQVVPEDDNFDYVSTGLAQYLNDWYLDPTIDPDHIGRKVAIDYTGSVVGRTYSSQDFVNDTLKVASWDISKASAADLIGTNIIQYVENMRDRGIFETDRDSRDIIYDGLRENEIAALTEGAILVGGTGNDLITGGSGDDIAYGGLGDDTFVSSAGRDVLWGGNEESKPEIQDEDTVTYAAQSTAISINYDGSASIKVNGLGGPDTLHAIEKIIGTTSRDYLRISGSIDPNTTLTIDANGGQTGPADIANGVDSDSGLDIQIDAGGSGYIKTIDTNGQINLLNFHTTIYGSDYDDIISDLSSGEKFIDAGEGDDEITIGDDGGRIYGGAGDDTIIGGAGQDTIIDRSGYTWVEAGAGNDTIVTGARAHVDGDAGDDYIRIEKGDAEYVNAKIRGGTGDDYIEIQGVESLTLPRSSLKISAGDGHDTIAGTGLFGIDTPTISDMNSYSIGEIGHSYGVGEVSFLDSSIDDITIYWNYTNNDSQITEDREYKVVYGNLAIVSNSTGESLFFENVAALVAYFPGYPSGLEWASFSEITLPWIEFSDGFLEFDDGRINIPIISGGAEAYNVASGATGDWAGSDVTGTSGNDDLNGSIGDDAVSGGLGDDSYAASGGADSFVGGDGIDTATFHGSLEDYTIDELAGGSLVITDMKGDDGAVTISEVEEFYFMKENRTFTTAQIDKVITGTNGNDTLTGATISQEFYGLGGDDTFIGDGGDDYMDGGDGNDIAVYSGISDDYVFSRDIDGTLYVINWWGDDGYDSLVNVEAISFLGDNVVIAPADIPMNGGAGDDIIVGTSRSDHLTGNGGNDNISGGASDDDLFGGMGDDVLLGGAGADTLEGGDGADALTGGDDDDYLLGGAGDDVLLGGAGADTLEGGDGADILTGGDGDDYLSDSTGANTFIYSHGDGNDTIWDGTWSGPGYGSLVLTDILASQVTVDVSGIYTVLHIDDGGSIKIGYQGAAHGLDAIQFADSTVWDRATIAAMVPAPLLRASQSSPESVSAQKAARQLVEASGWFKPANDIAEIADSAGRDETVSGAWERWMGSRG